MPRLFYTLFTAKNLLFTAFFTQAHFIMLILNQVMNVIRQKAENLTALCIERQWIETENRDWCIYVFEKWMGILLFFLAVVVWMVLSKRYVETVAFLLPFYLLRRRMGGYHAKSALACFIMSIGLVMFVSLLLGKWLMLLPTWALVLSDCAVISYAIALKPAYPAQLNFSQTEKDANNSRKILLLIFIFTLQMLSILFLSAKILANSLCGIALTVITVNIQRKI